MIHLYKQNDINICMDVESGAIHILEDSAYAILEILSENAPENCEEKYVLEKECPDYIKQRLPQFSAEEIEEAYTELFGLYEEDMLFAVRDYDIALQEQYPIKALCLHISHDCNLRCKYCFADGGDFGGKRMNMPIEVAKKAIDFVIERSGTRRNLEIDFFGGEPLINFDVVKQTVEYARSIEKQHNKNFRFTLTTNGVLLTEDVMDYLNREMSNVVLSLDGRKEVNDSVRIGVGGNGSYDRIVPKFQEFIKRRGDKSYYIRGTFTSQNLDFAEDVKHIKELGFDQVSVEPVVLDNADPFALREEHIPDIKAEYEKLTNYMADLKKKGEFFNFFHFMIDLEQGPCVIKRVKGCGCGNEYVAITPDGDIFPCHRFADKEEFCMGNVLKGTEISEEMQKYFSRSTVINKPECEKCWAKYYCSGGCPANNFNENRDILKPHKVSCELERKRIECAITLKCMALEDEDDA